MSWPAQNCWCRLQGSFWLTDVSMGRILMQWRVYCGCNDVCRGARTIDVNVDVDVEMGREWAVSHVTEQWSGSLGASFVPTDWRVRVFELSALIDRTSDRFSIWTITLYGCIGRLSCYTSSIILFPIDLMYGLNNA